MGCGIVVVIAAVVATARKDQDVGVGVMVALAVCAWDYGLPWDREITYFGKQCSKRSLHKFSTCTAPFARVVHKHDSLSH
jgi:hypothetical protein